MQITLTNWSKREFKTLATPISWPFFSTGGKHLGFGIYGIPMYTTFLDKEVNTMVSKDIQIMNTQDSSTHREKTDADISRHFKWIFVDAEYFDPSFILTASKTIKS